MYKTDSQAGVARGTVVLVIGVVIGLFFMVAAFMSGGDDSAGTAQKPESTVAARGFINFPKWKVRAPYKGDLTMTQTTTGNTALFSVKQLVDISKDCKDRSGSITRFKPDEDISPSGTGGALASILPRGHGAFTFTMNNDHADVDLTGNENTFSYINGYYYVYYPSSESCGEYDATIQATFNRGQGYVKDVASSLEAVK